MLTGKWACFQGEGPCLAGGGLAEARGADQLGHFRLRETITDPSQAHSSVWVARTTHCLERRLMLTLGRLEGTVCPFACSLSPGTALGPETRRDPSPMGLHALNMSPGVKGQRPDHCTQKHWRKHSRDDTSRCISSGCGHHRLSGLLVAVSWNRCTEPEGLLR